MDDFRHVIAEEYDDELGQLVTVRRQHPAYRRLIRNGGAVEDWVGSPEYERAKADPNSLSGASKRQSYYPLTSEGLDLMLSHRLSLEAAGLLLEIARRQKAYGQPLKLSTNLAKRFQLENHATRYRAVKALESSGLVTVERIPGSALSLRPTENAACLLGNKPGRHKTKA